LENTLGKYHLKNTLGAFGKIPLEKYHWKNTIGQVLLEKLKEKSTNSKVPLEKYH